MPSEPVARQAARLLLVTDAGFGSHFANSKLAGRDGNDSSVDITKDADQHPSVVNRARDLSVVKVQRPTATADGLANSCAVNQD